MNDTEKQTKRADRQALVDVLLNAGAVAKGKMFLCCFHTEKTGSLNVYEESGVWRGKCHGCGWNGDIFDAIAKSKNTTVANVLTGGKEKRQIPAKHKTYYATLEKLTEAVKFICNGWTLTQTDTYTNPDSGNHDLVVFRLEANGEKTFRQAHQTPQGYLLEGAPHPLPIFNRTRIKTAKVVWVVEGEKCVRAMLAAGAIATTSPGGAGKSKHADWTPLSGKTIYLWPDNDPINEKTKKSGGIEHMRDVAAILEKLEPPCELNWVDPQALGLAAKEDCADYLANGNTLEEKAALLEDAIEISVSLGASAALQTRIEGIASGKLAAIDWPWYYITRLTRALRPGTVTLLCGSPGTSKSFMLIQALIYWQCLGIKISLFALEDDRETQLHRALAQVCQCSELTDDEWLKVNHILAIERLKEHKEMLDKFGRSIYEVTQGAPTLHDIVLWIADRANAGCRIIAVDPITAADAGEREWQAAQRFMIECKPILRKHGSSLILVTHPRRGAMGNTQLDDLASGMSYTRFSQTVLSYEYEEPTGEIVETPQGSVTANINRKIHVRKARLGIGQYAALGFYFNPKTLLAEECGIIAS